MLINEVQYKVGLSKKSIRYYEMEGLLDIKRNENNKYREYNEDDIKKLKAIKFLRDLGVPINDIKKLKDGNLSLKDCMIERIKKMTEIENNFNNIKNMCKDIINKDISYNDLDINEYKNINISNNSKLDGIKTNSKKIREAILSSLVFCIFFGLLIWLITYAYLYDDMPLVIYIIMLFIFGIPVLGIIINLIERIKEIKEGKENEAIKY